LAGELEAIGLPAAVEPTYVHPQWPAVHLLHCMLALAGSLLAGIQPAIGFALVLVAATSFYLDLSGRLYLLRLIFFRRASQNVVAPRLPDSAEPDKEARVFVTAHYDTGLTGAAYNDWAITAFERVRRLWPARTSPQAVIFWSMAFLLIPLGLRMAGLEGEWIALLQLPGTVVLIVAAFMIGEIGLSPPSPGANDNAAGVAAALAVAERTAANPPENLRVHVLLCGAGESTGEGARAFLRSHRAALDRERTFFIDIDSPGRGSPRWVELEMPVLAQPAHPTLAELAEALAEGDPDRAALSLGPAGTASHAGARGYPALALTAREDEAFVPAGHHTPGDGPERVSAESVEAVAAFASDLISLLDRDLGRRN